MKFIRIVSYGYSAEIENGELKIFSQLNNLNDFENYSKFIDSVKEKLNKLSPYDELKKYCMEHKDEI